MCRSLRAESDSSSANRFFEYAGGLAFSAARQAEVEVEAGAAAGAEAAGNKGAAEDKGGEGSIANDATDTSTATAAAKRGAMRVCNSAFAALDISEVAVSEGANHFTWTQLRYPAQCFQIVTPPEDPCPVPHPT